METKCLYIGSNEAVIGSLRQSKVFDSLEVSDTPFLHMRMPRSKQNNNVLLFEAPDDTRYANQLVKLLVEHLDPGVVLLVVARNAMQQKVIVRQGVDDVFVPGFAPRAMKLRVDFLMENKAGMGFLERDRLPGFKLPAWKRVFDLVLASVGIVVLLPVLVLVAIAVRLESRGPVFYAAKRVGTGYKVFDFYKFRSMYANADKRVDQMMKQNQYANESSPNPAGDGGQKDGSTMLLSDENEVSEREFLEEKREKQDKAFFKVANDPRITRVGRFIRNTSIDELPQLFNVLKGDMSVVGNRPLPLYEAEKLTTDEWAERFWAPAGITGTWQVEKRGGANKMSSSERKSLDTNYARTYSFMGDLWIIVRTLPAMLQHENV